MRWGWRDIVEEKLLSRIIIIVVVIRERERGRSDCFLRKLGWIRFVPSFLFLFRNFSVRYKIFKETFNLFYL